MVPEQAQLLVSNLDRASTELWNQHLVAGLHTWRYPLAILVHCSGAYGEYFGFVELLHGRLGQEDTSCGLGFGLDALDKDAVKEGGDAADRLDCGLRGLLVWSYDGGIEPVI
jgi:hypothetical protein